MPIITPVNTVEYISPKPIKPLTSFNHLVKLLNMLSKMKVAELQEETLIKDKTLSLTFRALSDPGRLQIFKVLLEHRDICVSDIANILGVSVPAASRQLKILELSGLIEKLRNGQTTCFKVQRDNLATRSIIDVLKKVGA